jgi:uncharacterized protein
MELEGLVTNITAFGAFVDVGVHQDGLVHISELADRFVKDPHEVVKVGDKLQVRVLEVDLGRRRIALSARRSGAPRPAGTRPAAEPTRSGGAPGRRREAPQEKPRADDAKGFRNNPFASLLNKR